MPEYHALAIQHLDDFLYGTCPHPVSLKNGLVIGGGQVYPELNFTLPNMLITAETMPEVRRQYTQMITETPQARGRAARARAGGRVRAAPGPDPGAGVGRGGGQDPARYPGRDPGPLTG